jgi:dynein heavy chain
MLLDEAPSDDALPLEALNYVTGECNYGGRVTDDKDRILLTTILRNVYCSEMLRPGYKLSESGLYFPPEGPAAEGLPGVLEYIETLPIVPQPEAFGLHPNADIAKDMNDTQLMLNSLLVIDSGGGGTSKKGGGTEVDAVGAVVRDILARLPANFDIEAVQLKYPVLYEESMNTTLAQEMTRFNKLLEKIRTSLTEMLKAIQGLVVMSSDLETAYRSIAVNQVPAMWARVSYPSLKPLTSYVKDLLERLTMLQTWFEKGRPAVYWISGFFFAQSFMTAALQNYARKEKVAVDEVGFDFEFLGMDPGAYTKGPEEGVYIRGLYLEGCTWDPVAKQLCDSAPKVLHTPAPVIWLKPTPVSKMSQYPHYDCPIYRTAERRGVLATTGHSTNFVMKIRMPTDKKPSHWTMRGVAMLCALSD